MFRVVIIDDEPIIVEGLTKIVPWAKYGCTVVASANNGLSGKDIIEKNKPDIIISDIAMPKKDGLEMIAGLKKQYPEMEICILTGYRDFEYARSAVNLGVTRFLLKPTDMNEIEEALETMTDNLKLRKNRISESSINKDEHDHSSFIVENALRYIKEHYKRKISLAEVAENIYVSQWHLSKLLNKHLNQSFSDILNQIRIDEAQKLLVDPSLRIGDIAETVGFLDAAHFSRVFKKYTQVSANEYRNKVLTKNIQEHEAAN